MPRGRGSRGRQRKARKPAIIRKRILVVTEGTTTEPEYVELLESYLRSVGSTTTVKRVGVGRDPLAVVQKAVELRDKAVEESAYDHCVALVDVDTHRSLPQAVTLAAANDIDLLVSNLKFEVWLRWHVENKTSSLSSAQLDRLMAAKKVLSGKHLHPSFDIAKVAVASATARRVWPPLAPGGPGPDPSTAMPYLVDLMK